MAMASSSCRTFDTRRNKDKQCHRSKTSQRAGRGSEPPVQAPLRQEFFLRRGGPFLMMCTHLQDVYTSFTDEDIMEPATAKCAAGTLRRATRSITRVYDNRLARAGLT